MGEGLLVTTIIRTKLEKDHSKSPWASTLGYRLAKRGISLSIAPPSARAASTNPPDGSRRRTS